MQDRGTVANIQPAACNEHQMLGLKLTKLKWLLLAHYSIIIQLAVAPTADAAYCHGLRLLAFFRKSAASCVAIMLMNVGEV